MGEVRLDGGKISLMALRTRLNHQNQVGPRNQQQHRALVILALKHQGFDNLAHTDATGRRGFFRSASALRKNLDVEAKSKRGSGHMLCDQRKAVGSAQAASIGVDFTGHFGDHINAFNLLRQVRGGGPVA